MWRGRLGLVILTGLGWVNAVTGAGTDVWQTGLNLGATLTEGNAESQQWNLGVLTEGERPGLGAIRAGLEGHYAENKPRRAADAAAEDTGRERVTTMNKALGFINVQKELPRHWFAALDLAGLHDDLAEIAYRVTLSPGLGYHLLKTETRTLLLETGPAYIWDKVAGAREEYLAWRLAQRFEQQVSESARIWQSLEYLPKADDFSAALLNAELGAEAALNQRLNLRLVVQHRYDSEPGANLEKNDLIVLAGIGWTL
ncbi:MAG: DUF481 domain-containing protein [Candidatus Marinimicrobia bacterium]|nr:DUF481 domain-containing protein [Candidatus Neomarinimicrobiota bacterium]